MYGLPLISKSNLNRLIKLQKRAVRLVTNSTYNASTGPIFKHLGILKLEDMIKLELLKLGYAFTNSKLPQPIMSLF